MKITRRFPVVEIRGSHFEMGRQHGLQCRRMIHDLAARIDNLFLGDQGHRRDAHRAIAEALPIVRAAAPELVEEVQGIAVGADMSFDDVFRLNCSAEMSQWQGCQEGTAAVSISDQCTSFAARTVSGTLVAWNMDWYQQLLPYMVLLKGQPKAGPAFLAFALTGSVGRPGLSEHIAISANQLPYRPTETPPESGPIWAGPGVPYCFMSRMLLQQNSTHAALELIGRTRRMLCLNYTLGDAMGDICCVETSPAAHAVVSCDEGFVVHSNSYHSPTFHGMSESDRKERDPRAHTAHAMLCEHRSRLDRQAIHAVQMYHFPGQETGICHHGEQKGRQTISLLSFAAEVGHGRMWAAYGPPCEHEFVLYELSASKGRNVAVPDFEAG